jgi:hypothetical protein
MIRMATEPLDIDDSTISDLLVSCFRDESGFSNSTPAREATDSDWAGVFEEATRQGVAPGLYLLLKRHAVELRLPAEAFRRLGEQYILNAAKNVTLGHAFSRIGSSFKAEGIQVVPLKGLYLAEAVYGNPVGRSIGDLDLMVKESDLGRAERVLLTLGYEPKNCHRLTGPDIADFSYRHPTTGLIVELHWNLLRSGLAGSMDAEGLWERARPGVVAGQDVLTLCPEDLIIYLCVHTTKHSFQGGLRSMCDLFEVTSRFGEDLDWTVVTARAGEWGVSRSTYFALRLSRDLLRADVPDPCLEKLRPAGLRESDYRLARAEVVSPRHPNREDIWMSPNVAQLWGAGGVGAKLVLFAKRVFPSPAEMSRMYPVPPRSWKLVLYYPYRAADLLRRHGRAAWLRFTGKREVIDFTEHERALNSLRDWIHSPE